jgi:hypothetical protein
MKAAATCLIALLCGCSSAQRGEELVSVAPGGYAAAFEAAKETLTAYRFELDRVDARGGFITTLPKATSGLATPWDAEQSRALNEWEDLLNQQSRRVRITFEPVERGAEPPADLRLHAGAMTAHVEAIIDRKRRPGWRIETASIRQSSFTQDPALAARQMYPRYDTPFVQDHDLAERVGRGVSKRLRADSGAK